MRFETGYEKEGARIEMTPLMDVVFLLLVFFIYAVARMTTVSAVSVSLPGAAAGEKPGRHRVVTLNRSGDLWLDDEPVGRGELIGRLGPGSPGTPVLIRVDRDVPMEAGLSLLSDLQRAKWTSVAFQTAGPPAPRESVPPSPGDGPVAGRPW